VPAVESLWKPDGPFFVIAGPCVLESEDVNRRVAERLAEIASRSSVPVIFKASYLKDNRTGATSERGPGLESGLRMLAAIKEEFALPVLSDVHTVEEAAPAAKVLDALQVPAFLCRQSRLIEAVAATGRPMNVKKGQFLAPESAGFIVEKARAAGATAVALTERGASFGYGDLVVDPRAFPVLASFGVRVIFDVTHSLQRPGGSETGGDRRFAKPLARAAIAAGATALFLETHPNPAEASSDKGTQLPLSEAADFIGEMAEFADSARRATTPTS